MTLVEFISPLSNSSHRDRILAILYFMKHSENIMAMKAKDVKEALRNARAPNWSKVNISDVLSKSGHYVDSSTFEGRSRLWALTYSGDEYVRTLLKLPSPQPEIEDDVSTLSSLSSGIKDDEVRDYIDESIKCLQVGALRATIVFLWSGAIRQIQKQMLSYSKQRLNIALQKYDSKSRVVSRIDHFAYIKDRITILAANELGILDKNEKDSLIVVLDLRNRCGHPGKYKPGVKKVSSFVEDIISIVFS